MTTVKNDFWEVWAPESYIMTAGTAIQVREEMEEKLENALGFFVSLEHNDEDTDDNDDPVFYLFLHSDNAEDRTEEELIRMQELGLIVNDAEENNHKAICSILGITVTR